MTYDEKIKALSYHPLTPGRAEKHEFLRNETMRLAAIYDQHCPPSREASFAFTALQEALMWALAVHGE